MFLGAGLFGRCGQKAATPEPSLPPASTSTEQGPSFRNNIQLSTSGGLRLSAAYLTGNDGALLPPDNALRRGDTAYLHLVIGGGWMAENRRLFLGATQEVETASGDGVLSSGDLFGQQQGLPEKEGDRLLLPVVISRSRAGIPYFFVRFRVWDKKGPAAVSGSYRLQIADDD